MSTRLTFITASGAQFADIPDGYWVANCSMEFVDPNKATYVYILQVSVAYSYTSVLNVPSTQLTVESSMCCGVVGISAGTDVIDANIVTTSNPINSTTCVCCIPNGGTNLQYIKINLIVD